MSASEPFPDRALGGDGRAPADAAVDPELLRSAIDRHAAYIYRVALSIVRDRALADDVVQETMIRAWRWAPIQPDGEMPRAWLARVARNVAIGILRRRREELYGSDAIPEKESSATPARTVEGRAALDQLRGALDALDEADRALIVLREIEGLTYEEIAETMELPMSSVKTRLFRARQQLKRAMEEWR
jgi:RNA polymerase sigma-70 factor (ECF subfamily)